MTLGTDPFVSSLFILRPTYITKVFNTFFYTDVNSDVRNKANLGSVIRNELNMSSTIYFESAAIGEQTDKKTKSGNDYTR